MNKNIPDGTPEHNEPLNGPLAPVTRGLDFIADHQRFWLHGDGEIVTPETLDALRRMADQVIIIDLPEHVEVDPEPRTAVHPYPPIWSEMPPLSLGNLVEQIRAAQTPPMES